MGVDDRGDVVLVCDVAEQFVDEDGGLRVEAAVWFVAEQVAGIQRDGASDSHTFLHAAGDFAGILVFGTHEVDAFEAEHRAVAYLGLALVGKHHQGEHHVAQDGLAVEKG